MGGSEDWSVRGSYFEVCNCEAICPCRRQGPTPGEVSTYDTCDFALSWAIHEGHRDSLSLSGLAVVMAGRWINAEPTPPRFATNGPPWHVTLYVDETASAEQQQALAAIFLGRIGASPDLNYARNIGEVYAVRPARIELDHTPRHERIRAGSFVEASTAAAVPSELRISCGIPGHDHPGQEVVAERMRVADGALQWDLRGRCGFATDFHFRSRP